MNRRYNDSMTREELEALVADCQDDLIRELAGDNARRAAEDARIVDGSCNLDDML